MKVSSVRCTNLIRLNQVLQLSVLIRFRAGNILLEGFSSLEKDCSFLFGIAPSISHTLVFYLFHPIFRSFFSGVCKETGVSWFKTQFLAVLG